MKRTIWLVRLRWVFSFISLFAGSALIATGALSGLLIVGDRAALAPVVVAASDPLPPPGLLPLIQLAANWASVGCLVLAALIWLLWVFSATRLLKAAHAEGLHHGPFSAVAMHFVPVLSWGMPLLIMVELEKATQDPVKWRYLANSALAGSCWAAGKLSSIAFLSGFGLQASAETADQYATSLWFSIVGAAGCIASLYLFNQYLGHMERLQMALAVKIDGAQGEAAA